MQNILLKNEITAYLQRHNQKDLLRVLTCGSVDDGKSTLIGRLLFDSKQIYEDQLQAIEKDSRKYNSTEQDIDLALLVDGLQSEREQGITIDVAYRYFSTEARKFILIDSPGHEQYTRNMVTGASNAEVAIIIIDARKGVIKQSKRHSYLCHQLGLKHFIVAINKMDLINYSEQQYEQIKTDYQRFAMTLGIDVINFVPISALNGDNIIKSSENMSWYRGDPLIQLLESIKIKETQLSEQFRLPVQYVNRPNLDFRGFSGTVTSGQIHAGDKVTSLPSGKQSKVKGIHTFDGELTTATSGQAITVTLEDEIDISRGDILVKSEFLPQISNQLNATLIWMAETALQRNKEYAFKFASKTTFGKINTINYLIDIDTLTPQEIDIDTLQLNDIAQANINLVELLPLDNYQQQPQTGAFIIIDRISNHTVGAGMVEAILQPNQQTESFTSELELLVQRHHPNWGEKEITQFKQALSSWDCQL